MHPAAHANLCGAGRRLILRPIVEDPVVVELKSLDEDGEDAADRFKMIGSVAYDFVSQNAQVADLRQCNAAIANEELHRRRYSGEIAPDTACDEVVLDVQTVHA